ncbi:serine/threonine-protein kinase [Streptomyces sp. TRM 70351]|uniref:serine/threonine-protein kinase n=1 Tax=Streptomyces sp. TRM 70351 TaxID=3116552 RepID=UPI002E7B5C04|nr:serine/threonine-protein kinase [Streptomyces sp. TRM 70351]MEE1930449.1 serine/threonine-protein kinase [Streptomyces sp. TRM 70351]
MSGGTRGRVVDGRFELLERLGSGGMGTVWRARDLVLEREVALKEVRPPGPAAVSQDPGLSTKLRERVLREARALARLTHPHVVTIHHVVDQGPYPWLVMELLPGPSLARRTAAGPLPVPEAVRVARDVLAGLRAAHAAGVHHRDVKPANVLLRADGSAVLTDFGIAVYQDSPQVTATGDLVGSPEFMAPERVRGAADHPAADLWSLGMLLYVVVEGHSPMRRGSTLATLAAVLDEPVPPPVRSGPLAAVLAALLVRDPAARPDAAQVDGMLAAAASAPGAAPRQAPAPVAPPRPASPPGVPHPSAPPAPPAAGYGTPYQPTRYDTRRPGPPASGTPQHGTPQHGDTRPGGTPPGGGRRRRAGPAVGAAVCALAVLGTVAGGLLLSQGDGGSPAGGGAVPQSGVTQAVGPTAPESTAPATPSPSASPSSPAPAPSDTPGPSASPDAPRDDAAGQEPGAPGQGSGAPPGTGTWIAQLFSEPVSTGEDVRDRRLAAVREEVPEAELLRSDDFASLNPGYWVVHVPGPFADGRDAVRFCAERGRTSANACVGRYLSDDPADTVYVCHPQGGGSGRCTRP